MELLLHFSFAIYVPEIEEDDSATKLVLQAASNAPYLMHEVLALSARHLSTTRLDKSEWYLRPAVELHAKAIVFFNSTGSGDSRDNSASRLLFSSILGRHILVDALVSRDVEFPQFLDLFIHGIRVHRGTSAVTGAHGWHIFLNSEIGPLIAKGIKPLGFGNLAQLRPHFRTLISQATRLTWMPSSHAMKPSDDRSRFR